MNYLSNKFVAYFFCLFFYDPAHITATAFTLAPPPDPPKRTRERIVSMGQSMHI